MKKPKIVQMLSLIFALLLASKLLLPGHLPMHMAKISPAAHSGHASHTAEQTSDLTGSLPSCCDQNNETGGLHQALCCIGCPSLPGLIANFSLFTPYAFFTWNELPEQNPVFLAPPLHPPTV